MRFSRLTCVLIMALVITCGIPSISLTPPPGVALHIDINNGINDIDYKDDKQAKAYFGKMCKKIRRYWDLSKGKREKVMVNFGLMMDGSVTWFYGEANNEAAVQAIDRAAPFGPAPEMIGSTKAIWYDITLTL